MKQILFVLIMISISITGFAQKDFDTYTDDESKAVIYKGLISFDALKKETSYNWLAKDYTPNTNDVAFLEKELPSYQLIVFMGTWCSDSKTLIPKFYALLKQTKYPLKQLTMYAVDMEKKAKHDEQKKYDITLVPTIILMKNGKEAGRIVETVQTSIEADISNIIKDDSEN